MDEILNLIESISEGFPSYYYMRDLFALLNVRDENIRRKNMHSKASSFKGIFSFTDKRNC